MDENYDWLFGECSEDSPIVSQSSEIPEPIWITKNGDKIPLSKMETRHIINCINLLESKGKYKWKDSEKRKLFLESWYKIFQDELIRRRNNPLLTNYSFGS